MAPESFVGGPLALVRDGDVIELDVPRAGSNLLVDRRRAGATPATWKHAGAALRARLWRALPQHITQANEGCDFDFLEGTSPIPEPQIH